MKELKDYLHLYLGCKVRFEIDRGKHMDKQQGVGVFIGIDHFGKAIVRIGNHLSDDIAYKFIKPILRQLKDIDKDERFLMNIGDNATSEGISDILSVLTPPEFIYLLSKHFDIFGLIESGLAIDKTTLKVQYSNH